MSCAFMRDGHNVTIRAHKRPDMMERVYFEYFISGSLTRPAASVQARAATRVARGAKSTATKLLPVFALHGLHAQP